MITLYIITSNNSMVNPINLNFSVDNPISLDYNESRN
nr:MAG TPA: hypothetical protein [Caudoviricetes sp.]